MENQKKEETRKNQIEEMTTIWASRDEFSRGYLSGVIEATIQMATRERMKEPVA